MELLTKILLNDGYAWHYFIFHEQFTRQTNSNTCLQSSTNKSKRTKSQYYQTKYVNTVLKNALHGNLVEFRGKKIREAEWQVYYIFCQNFAHYMGKLQLQKVGCIIFFLMASRGYVWILTNPMSSLDLLLQYLIVANGITHIWKCSTSSLGSHFCKTQ